MPLTVGQTLGATVITSAKQRADMVNSTFVSSAEWLSYLNASYYELYDLLIQKFGADYFLQSPSTGYTFVTTGLVSHYALPADFYKLFGVDLLLSGSGETGVYATLKPFNFAERNRYSVPNATNWLGRINLRYRLEGNTLWLQPLPASGQTIRVWYAPRLTAVDGTGGAGDVIDGVSGWEEYMVCDMAIKALQKEESDVSVLMAQKQALIARIESAAENRDAGSPATVADTRWNSVADFDGGNGRDGFGGW